MAPINEWLRATRERQVNPDTGRPWSQEYLVARVNEWADGLGLLNENGQPWHLHRPNYVGYEGAKVPEAETLRRFTAFWADHGEPGPEAMESAPAAEPAPDLATALLAMARAAEAMATELAAMRAERELLATRVGDLEAQVAELVLAARASRGSGEPGGLGAVTQ
jgi:hypothetical protein